MRRDRETQLRILGYLCLALAAVSAVASSVDLLICLGVIKQ